MSSEVSPAFALMALPSTSQQLDVSEVTEAQLQAANAGSRFNDFYGRHAQFVARSLSRLGIRDELLDDALQEVFLIVYRKLPELDAAEHEKTWVFRITMNVAANLRR